MVFLAHTFVPGIIALRSQSGSIRQPASRPVSPIKMSPVMRLRPPLGDSFHQRMQFWLIAVAGFESTS
ncbi:hypothetical protein CKO51_23515 [Rhodopirellula sp. SM50]|nr:hypothetical protein CKO51_23515 [Rhodopirellula sp. SM50]